MTQLRTWSGVLAPLGKDEGECNILDLAVHLGREPRFGGYGDPSWTVLHHSFLCAEIWLRLGFPVEQIWAPLMHDTHEAYTRDIPSPIKAAINDIAGKDVCRTMERRIDDRISEHLSLPKMDAKTKTLVKTCDRVALVIESLLFGPTDCDLLDIVSDTERPDMVAMCERVLPGFQKMARRKGRL